MYTVWCVLGFPALLCSLTNCELFVQACSWYNITMCQSIDIHTTLSISHPLCWKSILSQEYHKCNSCQTRLLSQWTCGLCWNLAQHAPLLSHARVSPLSLLCLSLSLGPFLSSFSSGVLGEPGSSSFMFEHKGIIQLSLTEEDMANIDPLDLAIEVGAEDCRAESDDQGSTLQLQCEPNDLNAVCNAVKAKGLTVTSVSVDYLAKSYVALTEQQVEKAEKLVDLLSDHSDVVGVYSNYELDSE